MLEDVYGRGSRNVKRDLGYEDDPQVMAIREWRPQRTLLKLMQVLLQRFRMDKHPYQASCRYFGKKFRLIDWWDSGYVGSFPVSYNENVSSVEVVLNCDEEASSCRGSAEVSVFTIGLDYNNRTVIRELSGMILTRGLKLCNFVEWKGF
ncbi:hypothetical protein Tco_0586209 [Tanacetum coccineum]